MANLNGQVLRKATIAIQDLEPLTLRSGENSLEVEKLKRALSELHLFDRPVDAHYDFKTANSVRHAQRLLGLEETGVYNPSTWYSMTYESNNLVIDRPPKSKGRLSSIVQSIKHLLGVYTTS